MQQKQGNIRVAPASLWVQEYQTGGMPSSVRLRPSNVVVNFLTTVRKQLPDACEALDIGCGTGRNSVYLAEQGYTVYAMDYCAPQIEALQAAAAQRPELNLTAICAGVTERWPWQDRCVDFAIDAFCFKHQIDTDAIETYLSELARCLRPGGLFMLFLATRDDGYYSQFPAACQYGSGMIIVDEGNGIPSRLYSCEEIESLFGRFEVLHSEEKSVVNEMHGRTYERRSRVWHLRRP